MATIEVKIEINATEDKVWEIISDIGNEPKFWKGTKNVKNISKKDNVIHREVTIAFRDQKCLQEVTLEPKRKIDAKFTKGIINGSKTMTISTKENKTTLVTSWDMKLTGVMRMFTGVIKNHIKSGTEQAMQSIKEEAER